MRGHSSTRFSSSISADEYVAAGGTWKPDLHFTGTADAVEMRWLVDLIRQHDSGVVAHFVHFPLPGLYSIELMFDDDEESRRLMKACRSNYLNGLSKNGRLKPSLRGRFQ